MRSFLWFLNRLLILTILTGLMYAAMTRNHAHSKAIPLPGWYDEDSNTPIKDFKQPDNPRVSCCGEYDAYWADEFEIDPVNGDFYAIVTDPRADESFADPRTGAPRTHVPIGTRVLVPDRKVITPGNGTSDDGTAPGWQPPNDTGHGWLWLSVHEDDVTGQTTAIYTICYLRPAGL